jgi:hypothetical protein
MPALYLCTWCFGLHEVIIAYIRGFKHTGNWNRLVLAPSFEQGCQMVCLHTKNPNFSMQFLGMKNADILYNGHLEHFTVICCMYFIIICVFGHLICFFHFGMLYIPRKIWQPCFGRFSYLSICDHSACRGREVTILEERESEPVHRRDPSIFAVHFYPAVTSAERIEQRTRSISTNRGSMLLFYNSVLVYNSIYIVFV